MSPVQVAPLYLAEISVLDSGGTPRVRRYASGNGYVTSPSATPANTIYDARIMQPANVARHLFSGGSTQGSSRIGVGDLVLSNGDGALDGLRDDAFDGQTITVLRSTVLNPAYPADFATVFVGTMLQPEFSLTAVTIKARDLLAALNLPVQATKYDGSNVLPAGLEGVEGDLKGKPKPLVFGSAFNVAPPCVNTSKLIYQVNDGPIDSIPALYDRGAALAPGFLWSFVSPTAASPDVMAALAYGAGLFVMAGNNGVLVTSPDGITWTARTSSFGTDFISNVIWEPGVSGGIFVAVGSSHKIATSPDGITWTQRTNPLHGDDMTVAFGAGKFVVVGNPLFTNNAATSPDGVTWTAHAWVASGVPTAIAYGNGVFVVCGFSGLLYVSNDGITWTAVPSITLGSSGGILVSVYFRDGVFVVSGSGGGPFLATSFDGLVWVIRTIGVTGGSPRSIAFGPGLWVMIDSTSTIQYSVDQGATWIVGPALGGSISASTIFYANGTYVLTGGSGDVGVSIPGGYANTTDLEDDALAPAPGMYIVCPSAGYVRIGSSPDGQITADVLQGASAADRTTAQLFSQVLARAGYSSGQWSAADVTALDVVNSNVLGLYLDSESTFIAALDAIVNSIGAWWAPDQSGVFRIAQLTAPSGTPVLVVVASDLLKPLTILTTNDVGSGLPVYKYIVRWGRNYTVQTSDLAGIVGFDRRSFVSQDWRSEQYADPAVLVQHLLAPTVQEDSLLTTATDALNEATRRQVLRNVTRRRYELQLQLNSETLPVDLGQVINLTYARYGLNAGKLLRVLDVVPDGASNSVLLTVWG